MEFKIVSPEDRRLEPPSPTSSALTHRLNAGDNGELFAHIASFQPGTVFSPHSHTEDEVMVIVEGTMVVGEKEYRPGTVALIPANFEYGFIAGNEGLTFVVMRPRRSQTNR